MKFIAKKIQFLDENHIYPGMFDLAKGCFALFMLLWHSVCFVINVDFWLETESILVTIIKYFVNILSHGMIPMLFIISGYSWRKRRMRKALSVQVNGVIVPYCVVAITTTIVMLILSIPLKWGKVDVLMSYGLPYFLGLADVVSIGRWTLYGLGPMWFIFAYAFSAILLNAIICKNNIYFQITSIVLCACIAIILTNKTIPFCFQQILICTVYMYVGWKIKKSDFLTKKFPVPFLFIILIVTFILCFNNKMDISSKEWPNGLVDIVAGILQGIVFIFIFLKINFLQGKISQFIRLIGRNAFLLCCTHSVTYNLVYLLQTLLIEKLYTIRDNTIIVIIIELLANCFFTFLLAFLVKKIKKSITE